MQAKFTFWFKIILVLTLSKLFTALQLVSSQFFLKMTPKIFLIFCMKVTYNKGKKRTWWFSKKNWIIENFMKICIFCTLTQQYLIVTWYRCSFSAAFLEQTLMNEIFILYTSIFNFLFISTMISHIVYQIQLLASITLVHTVGLTPVKSNLSREEDYKTHGGPNWTNLTYKVRSESMWRHQSLNKSNYLRNEWSY